MKPYNMNLNAIQIIIDVNLCYFTLKLRVHRTKNVSKLVNNRIKDYKYINCDYTDMFIFLLKYCTCCTKRIMITSTIFIN